jgi:hypothetical protein
LELWVADFEEEFYGEDPKADFILGELTRGAGSRDVRFWHFASIRTHGLNGRYRGIADIDRHWR